MGQAPAEGHASPTAEVPPRVALAPGLEASRVVVGLWQVADMERGGQILDPEPASSAMLGYARAGFDSFDMADHYGSAELIAGRFLSRVASGSLRGRHAPSPSRNGARLRDR